MAAHTPSDAWLVVGARNLSGDQTYALDETVEAVTEEVHGLGDSWEAHKPVGLARVLLEAPGGIYDDLAGKNNSAYVAMGSTRQIIAFGMDGMTYGESCVMIDGDYANVYKRMGKRDGLTAAHAMHKITGKYYRGAIIVPLSVPFTAEDSDSEALSVDNADTVGLPSGVITSSSVANPTVITSAAHGLVSGEVVIIAGHSGSTPTINGQRTVTVTGTNTFTIPVNVSVGGTGGTWTKVSQVGGVIDYHLIALTLDGYSSVELQALHSADDATFTAVGTVAASTAAPDAERVTVATTIHRYRAAQCVFKNAAEGGSGRSATALILISNLA
jgi:hypothetical protein